MQMTRVLLAGFMSVIFLACIAGSDVRAAVPTVKLYPATGYAELGKNFSIDIMLDTGGQDTISTQAVFRFDPSKVRVTKAEYGDLYCQYPTDEYTVDNTLGWVKLTGFCLDPAYNSGSSPGLFGRITFIPLVTGTTTFRFEETGSDDEWISKLTNDGSPPQAISPVMYTGGTYTIVSSVNSGGSSGQGSLPGVGLFDGKAAIYGGGLLACAGTVFVADTVIRRIRRKFSDNPSVVIQ
ncbi:MAG: hypothetical protein PHG63_04055 [Candidatus Dojkabacteria bacterium]|nr:hypothetical protein [Candidatus Dojkabacteria bacterium]